MPPFAGAVARQLLFGRNGTINLLLDDRLVGAEILRILLERRRHLLECGVAGAERIGQSADGQRRDLQQRLGLTTIFVTHDQEEANSVCDRIAVLNDGAVQQVGTPMELYQHPANLFVAGFLGTANTLSGHFATSGAQNSFEIKDGIALPLPAGSSAPKDAMLVFRPQHAVIKPSGAPGLAGKIVHREFLGATVRYGVVIAGSEILVEAPFFSADSLLEVGTGVSITI